MVIPTIPEIILFLIYQGSGESDDMFSFDIFVRPSTKYLPKCNLKAK